MIRDRFDYKGTVKYLNGWKKDYEDFLKLADKEKDHEAWKNHKLSLEAEIQTQEKNLKEFEALVNGDRQPDPIDTIFDVPRRLIEYRVAKGWSQEELAEKAGVDYIALIAYERSDYEKAPFVDMLHIAGALEHCEPENKVNELEEARKLIAEDKKID